MYPGGGFRDIFQNLHLHFLLFSHKFWIILFRFFCHISCLIQKSVDQNIWNLTGQCHHLCSGFGCDDLRELGGSRFFRQNKSQQNRSKKFRFNFQHSNLNSSFFSFTSLNSLMCWCYILSRTHQGTNIQKKTWRTRISENLIPSPMCFHDFTIRPAVDRRVALQACLEAQIARAVPRLAAELHRSSMRWTDGTGRGLGLQVFEVTQLVEL